MQGKGRQGLREYKTLRPILNYKCKSSKLPDRSVWEIAGNNTTTCNGKQYCKKRYYKIIVQIYNISK